ncbi:MAG TPA: cyclodeaminase/cyclohydrolase family protein [Vicinamibacterales bacterium]|nr:cyclodeaminase/cyclohydrolase family protein [Vicinamibacterales bacterium]
MTRFTDMTVAQLLAALSNSEPTPGGGTAAAIAGAMGTSLLVMVTGLAKSKTNTDEEKSALAGARAALEPLGGRLTQLADADTESFNAVMAAFRLPKTTDEEKAARTAAIQLALRGATTVPLETLRACIEAIDHGRTVAAHGNRSASSDVGVAIGLLKAAADGAAANVRINLASLKDASFVSATEAETARLTQTAAAHATAALHSSAG